MYREGHTNIIIDKVSVHIRACVLRSVHMAGHTVPYAWCTVHTNILCIGCAYIRACVLRPSFRARAYHMVRAAELSSMAVVLSISARQGRCVLVKCLRVMPRRHIGGMASPQTLFFTDCESLRSLLSIPLFW